VVFTGKAPRVVRPGGGVAGEQPHDVGPHGICGPPEENDRLHATLDEEVPRDLRTEMVRLLEVPENKHVSGLERLRLDPMRVSAGSWNGPWTVPSRFETCAPTRSDGGRIPTACISDKASAEVVTPTESGSSNYIGTGMTTTSASMTSGTDDRVRQIRTPRGVVR
jgi:hypothetical protein